MKKLSLIIIFFLSFLSLPSWSDNLTMDNLVFHKGFYYKKISDDPFFVSDIPFSGEIIGKSKGSFVEGQQEGPWVYYYNNGNLMKKGSYKNGILHGFWEDFTDSGILLNTGNYENGECEGPWKRYYRNGQLMSEGIYLNGNKNGIWKYYYKDGTPMKTVTWKEGVKQND